MEYFIYKDNKQQGPFTKEQLAKMNITSETLIWCEGMAQWTPAWQILELRGVIFGKAEDQATPPPPPTDGPDDGTAEEQTDNVEAGHADKSSETGSEYAEAKTTRHDDGRRHRRAVKWLAAAAVAFFILLMTCPKEDKHYEAVTHEITEAVTDSASRPSTGIETIDMIGGMLGQEIARQFVGAMVTQFVTVDNYIIFSVGKIEYNGRSEVISLGIIGHVFTFKSTDLTKVLKRNSPLPDTMAL